MSRIRFALISSGAVAPQNELAIYAKNNRKLYTMDQDGTETQLLTTGDKILQFSTDFITLTQENIDNGYFNLLNLADGSFFMIVRQRVVYCPGEDVTLSDVDEVTRVTFGDALKSGGFESLEKDEKLIVVYTR